MIGNHQCLIFFRVTGKPSFLSLVTCFTGLGHGRQATSRSHLWHAQVSQMTTWDGGASQDIIIANIINCSYWTSSLNRQVSLFQWLRIFSIDMVQCISVSCWHWSFCTVLYSTHYHFVVVCAALYSWFCVQAESGLLDPDSRISKFWFEIPAPPYCAAIGSVFLVFEF